MVRVWEMLSIRTHLLKVSENVVAGSVRTENKMFLDNDTCCAFWCDPTQRVWVGGSLCGATGHGSVGAVLIPKPQGGGRSAEPGKKQTSRSPLIRRAHRLGPLRGTWKVPSFLVKSKGRGWTLRTDDLTHLCADTVVRKESGCVSTCFRSAHNTSLS